jgi:hypothetical protein
MESDVLERLTHEDFAPHVGARFAVGLPDGTLDLVLLAVRVLGPKPERLVKAGKRSTAFGITLRGPADAFLKQGTWEITHPVLGPIGIFLVPVGQEEAGFLYEAIFN